MSYNYHNKIIDTEYGSYQEKFLEYASNWEDEQDYEKKKVKISNKETEDPSFEDKINSFIYTNKKNIKIFDIKYQKNSVLIIYEDRELEKENV